MKYIPDEIHEEITALYVTAVFYMILAIYLNQIVPQQYGVPKHPLFFLENIIKKINPKWHRDIFNDDDKNLVDYGDAGDLKGEDDDVRAER